MDHKKLTIGNLKVSSKNILLFALSLGAINPAIACSSCTTETPKFYETLNQHLEDISKTLSNGTVDKKGSYNANKEQIEKNIVATIKLEHGDFFYFSSSVQQRSVFKKCSFSMIYGLYRDFGETLKEIKYCPLNYCNEKIAKDLAGLTIKMLEKEIQICKLELETVLQNTPL